MIRATVNGKIDIAFEVTSDGSFIIDSKGFSGEVLQDKGALLILKTDNRIQKVKIISSDPMSKTYLLEVNGKKHQVVLKDDFDLILEKMGIKTGKLASVNQIKAPMPGLIVEVSVKQGQEVNKGDKVLVLEAMKMENVIKAPGKGKIKDIPVRSGESVEKNQVLIELD